MFSVVPLHQLCLTEDRSLAVYRSLCTQLAEVEGCFCQETVHLSPAHSFIPGIWMCDRFHFLTPLTAEF